MDRRKFLLNSSLTLLGSSVFSGSTLGKTNSRLFALSNELDKHKVEKVKVMQVNFRWPRPVGRNGRKGIHGQEKSTWIAKIHTDQGATGWGLTRRSVEQEWHAIKGKSVSELLVPSDGIKNESLGNLDIPLFDLAGKIMDKPVYQLLGEEGTVGTPVYSGMIYLDELDEKGSFRGWDQVLRNCEWDYNYGYRYFKVKIGRSGKWYGHGEGLLKDIEIVNLIHEHFKDKGVRILVDSNDMYSLQDTFKFLEGVKDVPLYWVEEPFRENLEEGKELKKWLMDNGFAQTFYADGEANPDHEVLQNMIDQQALDIYLTDIFGYGFSNWINFNEQLKRKGIMVSPHAWGDRLKTHYIAQFAAGRSNVPIIEGVTCLSDDIDYGLYPLVNGKILASDKPGFGMELLKSS